MRKTKSNTNPRAIWVIALKRIYGRYCELKSTQAIVFHNNNGNWLSIPLLSYLATLLYEWIYSTPTVRTTHPIFTALYYTLITTLLKPYKPRTASLKSHLSGKGLLKCHWQLTIYPFNNLIRLYGSKFTAIPTAEK